jgi:hypothetical protein
MIGLKNKNVGRIQAKEMDYFSEVPSSVQDHIKLRERERKKKKRKIQYLFST